MPLYWVMSSIIMLMMLMLVFVDFYFFKKMESYNLNECISINNMLKMLW